MLHSLTFFVCVIWFPFRMERFANKLEVVAFFLPMGLIAYALAWCLYNSHSYELSPVRYYLSNISRSVGIIIFSYALSPIILALILYLIVPPDPPGHRGTTMRELWSSMSFFIFWFFFATWPAWLAGHFLIFGFLAFKYQKSNARMRSDETLNEQSGSTQTTPFFDRTQGE